MLNWLTENVSVFKIQYDAHREFHLSVAEHLAHRTRIGNPPLFLRQRDEEVCVRHDILWELRVVMPDGSSFDIAGSTLENCISAVRDLAARQASLAA
ncbi:MAG: hypothetical protein ABW048_10950 [Sphingobium sp.]